MKRYKKYIFWTMVIMRKRLLLGNRLQNVFNIASFCNKGLVKKRLKNYDLMIRSIKSDKNFDNCYWSKEVLK